MTTRRQILAAGASSAALLLLSACGGESADSADSASSTTAGDDAFPVTIKHVYGETTIEKKPTRVATVAWANHEVPLALGVVPVGMAKADYGDDNNNGLLPWVEEKLKELGAKTPVLFDETEGIDFEGVADTKPDVILGSYSGLTKEDYTTLSKIAPTIAYPDIAWATTYQQMIEINSKAIGLASEGAALITTLEAQVKTAYDARPALAGKKVIFSYIDPKDLSQIGYYTSIDTRPGFLVSIGLQTPAVVKEFSATSKEFYTTVSSEQADKFNDVQLWITYGDAEGKLVKTLQTDKLIGTIPAIKAGAVANLVDGTPLAAMGNPSPLSIPWGIEKYFDLLNAAAEKAPQS